MQNPQNENNENNEIDLWDPWEDDRVDFGMTEAIELLNTLHRASTVTIQDVEVADDAAAWMVRELARFEIDTLDLENSTLGSAGMRSFARFIREHPSLRNVSLSWLNGHHRLNGHHPEMIDALRCNTRLETLALTWLQLPDHLIRRLADVLRVSAIRKLRLSWNQLDKDTIPWLASAIADCEGLEELDLNAYERGQAQLTAPDACALAHAIRFNTHLRVLNLSWNAIRDDGTIAFADALCVNDTLLELDLTGNAITDVGLVRLCETLRTDNRTLRKLILKENPFTDESARALAYALETNCALQTLEIYNCNLHTHAVSHFAEALRHNSALQSLKFSGEFGEEGVRALNDALDVNYALHNLVAFGFGNYDPNTTTGSNSPLPGMSHTVRCCVDAKVQNQPRRQAILRGLVCDWVFRRPNGHALDRNILRHLVYPMLDV